jgi:hypothetical protein
LTGKEAANKKTRPTQRAATLYFPYFIRCTSATLSL